MFHVLRDTETVRLLYAREPRRDYTSVRVNFADVAGPKKQASEPGDGDLPPPICVRRGHGSRTVVGLR